MAFGWVRRHREPELALIARENKEKNFAERDLKWSQGGDLNSRPRRYECRALTN